MNNNQNLSARSFTIAFNPATPEDYKHEEFSKTLKPITVATYEFDFPSNFEFIEERGIDSYVGRVAGLGINFFFDYGWYTSPRTNLSPKDYQVSVDTISGHYRQIVKTLNPLTGYSSIHLFKIEEALKDDGAYNSLTLGVSDLYAEELEMAMKVFASVRPFE